MYNITHTFFLLSQNLPLTCCRIFFLLLFYLNFSSREKLQKRPALQKQSFCVLFRSCMQHPSVTQNFPQTTFRSVIGDKRTRFSRNNGNAVIHRSNNFYPVSVDLTVVCYVLDSAGDFRKLPVCANN